MSEKLQTVIFLVRHGETDFAYVNDPSVDKERVLTKKGMEQSKNNGQYLADFGPIAVYSSPLKRTVQTAEIICQQAGVELAVQVNPELLEIYDDQSWQSIATRLPKLFRKLISQHAGKQVVCVTHQDVIEGALGALKVTSEEADFPCRVGEMYRTVFAGEEFVQATKITVNT